MRYDTQNTNISKIIAELPIGSANKRENADDNIFTIDNNFNSSMYLHRPYFRLGGREMFKELIYTWLFKGLEIVLVAVLGYFIFILLESTFATLWAILGLTIIMYFWGALIKPYIDTFRKWLYAKITGVDCD